MDRKRHPRSLCEGNDMSHTISFQTKIQRILRPLTPHLGFWVPRPLEREEMASSEHIATSTALPAAAARSYGISSLFQSMILPPNANQAGPRHIDWSAATLDCTVGLQLQASNDECYGLQVPANPAPQWNGSVRVDFEFEAPSSPCSRGGPFSNSVLPNRNRNPC